MTYTRKATADDIPAVMEIITAAIAYLAEQGSPQWQANQGPTESIITEDVLAERGYVLIFDQTIVGYVALVAGPDLIYEAIEGNWADVSRKYVAIHRVAVSQQVRGQGLSQTLMNESVKWSQELGYTDIRIDTYPKNMIMQKVIQRAGFSYQGMIHFPFEHGERFAYQLIK